MIEWMKSFEMASEYYYIKVSCDMRYGENTEGKWLWIVSYDKHSHHFIGDNESDTEETAKAAAIEAMNKHKEQTNEKL